MKISVDELAILGGSPAFQEKLHVGRPNVGNRARLIERINEALDRRWLTNEGPHERELEKRLADFLDVKYCVPICNATVAMEIAIRALGLIGEVIVPSFTFIATPHSLQWQQITPVFCDVDPATHSLDPRQLEKLITPRTTGIIGVHLWGRPCDVDGLTEIAKRNNLKLLFDAAHSFACSYKGRMLGSFGDAEVFSFHATKFFNSLEGGAVATNNAELANKIRLMKNFGFTNFDEVSYVGTNGKMSEFSAAMGLTSLESLDEFVTVNRRNYQSYQKELAGLSGIKLFLHHDQEKCNYQYVVLEVDEDVARLSRDELMKILWAENVMARRYFYPGCHRMEPYRSFFPDAGLMLPETETLAQRVLCLPTGTAVGESDIAEICGLLRLALSHAAEVRDGMANFKYAARL